MNAPLHHTQRFDLASALPVGSGEAPRAACGPTAYLLLTGCDVATARIDDDRAFDRHVFASLLAVAAAEGGVIGDRVGLADDDLTALMERWFPMALDIVERWHPTTVAAEDDEIAMVRDLLLAHRSTADEDSRWLAFMIARRAMESNHLWEDLRLARSHRVVAAVVAPFCAAGDAQCEKHEVEAILLSHAVRNRRLCHVQHAGVHGLSRLRSLFRRGERRKPSRQYPPHVGTHGGRTMTFRYALTAVSTAGSAG